MRPFDATFGTPRVLIGMIHVGALPGAPAAGAGIDALAERAASDARLYERAGFHAVLIENMHDRPYLKASAGPEIVAAMTTVALAVRAAVRLPLGVQILAAANREAIAVAHASGAAFVRVEGFVFSHVADEGLIDGCAGELLRYRRAIGADRVLVFADIKKKHAAHAITGDVDLAETARAAEFFLADGVIVTGAATGRHTDAADVERVSSAVALPVIVGSGTTPDNITQFPSADGFIVGSALKHHGVWSNPIDARRVDLLVEAFNRLTPRA
jgi:membrane complex biogenesis BtpA family protein